MTGVQLIECMDREALVTLWKDKFPEPVPRRISLTLLRQILAFEAQSKQLGGLPSGFADRLKKQVQTPLSRRATTEPRPGEAGCSESGTGRPMWSILQTAIMCGRNNPIDHCRQSRVR